MRVSIVATLLLIGFSGCAGADKREVAEIRAQTVQMESRVSRLEGTLTRLPLESMLALEIVRLKAERARRLQRWNEDTLEIREIDAQISVFEKEMGREAEPSRAGNEGGE